jgi:putative peptide maturation system protein
MMDSLQQAVLHTLDWLMILDREGIRPETARERLRDLQAQHPDTRLDLVWEQEAFDGSVHYDALLRLPEGGTVSLSFCPDRALPWPLRGVHRWSEADLARVNGRVLKVDEAMAILDLFSEDARLVDRLVNACLIQEALEKDPIELPDAELQEALDAFRRARRLYTADETRRWMERRGLTHEKLEHLVAGQAVVAALRDRVTAGRVESYFDARRADFDTACIARLDLPGEEEARQVSERIRRGDVTFDEAARRSFLEGAARRASPSRPLFELLRRRQATRELADAVFAAAPGDIVGPLRAGEAYAVVQVLALDPARLDAPTRRAVQEILFVEWLAERRQAAAIEWCWGNVRETPQGT